MEKDIKFKDLIMDIMQIVTKITEIDCNELPSREEFFEKFGNNIISDLLIEMCWLEKKQPFHKEGTCFAHTKLVIREMSLITGHDCYDLVVALFHDIGEYRFMKNEIDSMVKTIVWQFKILDHSEVELVQRALENSYIDKINPELNSELKLLDEDITKYIKDNPIKNKGHENMSKEIFLDLINEYVTGMTNEERDAVNAIAFCIKNHMLGHFIDVMKDIRQVTNLVSSKSFGRLKRIWLADYNGRISDDPKMTMGQLNKKVMSNPIAAMCLKPKKIDPLKRFKKFPPKK